MSLDDSAARVAASPTWDSINSANAKRRLLDVDRQLRALGRTRAALDAEELELIRFAEKHSLHLVFKYATLFEYLEAALGYKPKTIPVDRLRLASRLEVLPATKEAFEKNEISRSTAREMSRVATVDTEKVWLDATKGKTLREVERMTTGHVRGDLPGAPRGTNGRAEPITFELTPQTLALHREVQLLLSGECKEHLSDDDVMAMSYRALLQGNESDRISRRIRSRRSSASDVVGRGSRVVGGERRSGRRLWSSRSVTRNGSVRCRRTIRRGRRPTFRSACVVRCSCATRTAVVCRGAVRGGFWRFTTSFRASTVEVIDHPTYSCSAVGTIE